MSWLLFDIGNTAVKAAIVKNDEVQHLVVWARNDVTAAFLSAQFETFSETERIERIGLSSVVPEVTRDVLDVAAHFAPGKAFVVSAECCLPFSLKYETPQTLGADRLAAATAAYLRFGRPLGKAVISVDAGTAVTYEVVTAEGSFIGGAIAPGPRTMARALAHGTAQLPKVDIATDAPLIGRSTYTSIQSGVMYAFIDSVRGMIDRLTAALPDNPSIVLTGGWSELVSPHLNRPHEHVPELVLDGVRLLMALNR